MLLVVYRAHPPSPMSKPWIDASVVRCEPYLLFYRQADRAAHVAVALPARACLDKANGHH